MPIPMKTCVICGAKFELKPDKPGFANRCLDCSVEDAGGAADAGSKSGMSAEERKSQSEVNEARRKAMKELLYRKDQ
jgi:hypothetical protein